MAQAPKRFSFARQIVTYLQPGKHEEKVVMCVDTSRAIHLAKNSLISARPKDIDIRCHFLGVTLWGKATLRSMLLKPNCNIAICSLKI